ncbi:MAG: arginine-tRNA-protein transferase [Pyrinomonadaceae bacterium]
MLVDADFRFIHEEFYTDRVTPGQLDLLLADGWRHFGEHFFRYNVGLYEDEIRRVLPLRIRLADFKLSKSQRRTIRKNADLVTQISPIQISNDTNELFERHRSRFKSGAPQTLYDFLSLDPSGIPTPGFELRVHNGGSLVAASFFDVGLASVSSIYGMFDPDLAGRGLGIFTMLKEIEFAQSLSKQFYYHGYAYEGSSFYDYKKRFSALETYDWKSGWHSLSPDF